MRALPQHCCTQASVHARVRREARATQAPLAGARDTGAPGRRATQTPWAGAPQRQQLLPLLAAPDDVDGPHTRALGDRDEHAPWGHSFNQRQPRRVALLLRLLVHTRRC